MAKTKSQEDVVKAFNQEAENRSNRSNIRCLLIMACMLLLCEILNEIGVFQVVPLVMRIGTACGAICYLTPVIVLSRPIRLFYKNSESIYYRTWYKYFIIAFAWLGTVATCMTLTHHTVMVMAIPIIIMSQYRDTRKLVPLTVLFASICVFLSVYGGYFWGCFDANLLHIGITDDNAYNLAMRREMATMKRMIELLTHYVLPRELIILALTLLAGNISHRNDNMLDHQEELQTAIEQEMQRTNEIQWQIINSLANLIENRDADTGEHVKRTSYYVRCIVTRLQSYPEYSGRLNDEKSETIVKAAPLHDIGKIVVSDLILQKPGKLTPEEYEEIKLHASEGAKVIENVLGNVEDEDFLCAAKEIAEGHHERWDGKGYPKGLKGENIPLSARIMAVADVFDALVSKRVYKSSIPSEEAFDIIENESGKQFDPEVVKVFCSMRDEIIQYLDSSEKDEPANGN